MIDKIGPKHPSRNVPSKGPSREELSGVTLIKPLTNSFLKICKAWYHALTQGKKRSLHPTSPTQESSRTKEIAKKAFSQNRVGKS